MIGRGFSRGRIVEPPGPPPKQRAEGGIIALRCTQVVGVRYDNPANAGAGQQRTTLTDVSPPASDGTL
jgi:hypothetical protein